MPCGRQCLVQADLLGRHGLDLHHLVAPAARTRSPTIRFAAAASAAQWTVPPALVTVLLELEQVRVEVTQGTSFQRRAGVAQLLPVVELADGGGTLVADDRRWPCAGCAAAACPRARCGRRPGKQGRRGRPRRSFRQGALAPRWRPGSRPGGPAARLRAGASRPPPMCIRQLLSAAHSTSAPLAVTSRSCRRASRWRWRRSSRRTCRRSRSMNRRREGSTRSMPRTARSRRSGRSPTRSIAQRVAGRVVSDAVRVVRADVFDTEHIDQQLGQLEHAARRRRSCAGSAASPYCPASTG